MTAPRCPYASAPTRQPHVLQPLPIASIVTFHVDDRPVPAVAWTSCIGCGSSVAIPLITPGKE